MLTLQKAGHRDLERYYPLLETDFDSEELVGKLAFLCGLRETVEPASPRELLADFSWERVKTEDIPVDPALFPT